MSTSYPPATDDSMVPGPRRIYALGGMLAVAAWLGCSASDPRPAVTAEKTPAAEPTPKVEAAQAPSDPAETEAGKVDIDARVEQFLDDHRDDWRDWNVPYEDGKVLHDLIVDNKYRSVLEIGTSTGHSTIWMAWAVSKTGGKVITIEIDEKRYRTALANFEKAGVAGYIDARLADAHELVPQLPGPFDFVFSDADKDWYTQYFKDVDPKLVEGGCVTAHNATSGFAGVDAFLRYVRGRKDYDTTIDRTSRSGMSISCKRKSP